MSMELGGNAPFLVMADADLDAAVEGAMLAKMRNMGQACTAANRFLVHEGLADDFTRRLADRMSGLRVGRGTDPDVQVGPLVDEAFPDKVASLVQDAVHIDARVLTGGEAVGSHGWFYVLTVLSDMPLDAGLLEEQIFGPVAPIVRFSSADEAIQRANDSPYGLVAYAYTRDMSMALRLAEEPDTGMVGIIRGVVSNPAAPFGGAKHGSVAKAALKAR